MTHPNKAKVTAQAKSVLRLMKTPGWKICVSENEGWHWCLENVDGHFTLRKHDGGYYCLLSDGDYRHTGSMQWSTGGKSFKDPNLAVARQLKAALAYAAKTNAWLIKVSNALIT